MNKISFDEHREILINLLKHVDNVCRDNGIKYSLIGGSLIGAIRHGGIIPWDDDIDIILTKDNYDKLKEILDGETGRFQTLKDGKGGERFFFTKLIDTKTQMMEQGQLRFDSNYGIYIDIFCYYPISNDLKKRKKQYKKLKLLVSLVSRRKTNLRRFGFRKTVLCIGKNIVSFMLGYKKIKKLFNKTMCGNDNSNFVVSGWPAYGFDKEIQLRKNTKKYIDVCFEGLNVMIFSDYDSILRTTFGDYMTIPPAEERIPKHDTVAWWRDSDEKV